MELHIDRETQLCISLSARPSNHGARFHNWLYSALKLNYIYKPFAPDDITAAIAGIRGLGIRGAGVSMPYKAAVIPLIDALHPSAERLGAVNTIVNDEETLTGYNTDYIAVSSLLASHEVDPSLHVAVRGSGGMANAVIAALADYGLHGTVVARNHSTGAPLAQRYGFDYSTEVPENAQMLVNVTPLGMRGSEENTLSFSKEHIEKANVIFDVVADPWETPLIKEARAQNKKIITGQEVICLQAVEQFVLYTGVRPDDELIREAENFASS